MKFPFVTPPNTINLVNGLEHLWILGAIRLGQDSRKSYQFYEEWKVMNKNIGGKE